MKYDLKSSIAYRITRAANNLQNTINKKLSQYDIAIEQRATLEIIKFEKNVNQKSISNFLSKDKTTISRSLNALEKKGLITKIESESDKRSNKIELTNKAELLLENTIQEVTTFRESLHSKLTDDEIIMFHRIIDKLEL